MDTAVLRRTLQLALAAGLAACAARQPGNQAPFENQDPSLPGTEDPSTSEEPSTLVGTAPADLDAICGGEYLEQVTTSKSIDFLALRVVSNGDAPEGEQHEPWSRGVPCMGATDPGTCEQDLDALWPSSSGWGHCEPLYCSDYGLVSTEGNSATLHQSTRSVAQLFGEIDHPSEALYLARTTEHEATCPSLVETVDGDWRFEAKIITDLCPWTEEIREIEVSREGVVSVLRTVSVDELDVCAGRLPAGVHSVPDLDDDTVGAELARFAWLEAAAVPSFQQLVDELEGYGAPAGLVNRARAAVDDEVRHARVLGDLARRAGANVKEVTPPLAQHRTLVGFAVHNTVEGCVRETFGVVDAAFRSVSSTDAEVRAAFATIAEDEARHAELSWDIAAWVEARLSPAERREVEAARSAAHGRLVETLWQSRRASHPVLGAPDTRASVAMARVLAAA